MAKIPTPNSKRERRLFHDAFIDVYPTTLPLEKIHFWPQNNRTIFTFERLERENRKRLEDIPLETITKFVAEQDIHQIDKLANSIASNGVRIPLIIRDDGKLLDGNRRFFACQWLKTRCEKAKEEIPEFLSHIPVFVIRKVDLRDPTLELKILAEANFVPDYKVDWSLDAQARAVDEYYRKVRRKKKKNHEAAIGEIVEVFGMERAKVVDLIEALKLTKRFIAGGKGIEQRYKRREIVEERFVYFWEFLNKAMKGGRAISIKTELDEVRGMFFDLMAKRPDSPLRNVKQVEPLIQARRIRSAWAMLTESKGAKLSVVVSMVNERKEIRKAEDKIRNFYDWLQEVDELSEQAKGLLVELASLVTKKSKV